MDFLEAMNYLMRLRNVDPDIGYHFVGDVLVVHKEIWTVDGTRENFVGAAKMFEPL